MNTEKIAALFTLFSGDDTAAETYADVLDMAVQEVELSLCENADQTDQRLNFLAAALGYLRYTELTAARDKVACTFAGTIAQNTDSAQKLEHARLLVQAYRTLCRDLLTDSCFVFQAIAPPIKS